MLTVKNVLRKCEEFVKIIEPVSMNLIGSYLVIILGNLTQRLVRSLLVELYWNSHAEA